MKSGVIMVIIEFTYLLHPEQPLAHSSVSSYQRLYSPASNKVHTRTRSLSATIAAAGTGWWTGEPDSLARSQEYHRFKFSSKQQKLTNMRS